jgi:anti-sigma factor RsiW
MTCELWRDQIEGYIDGELASSHEAEIAGHLRTCASCNAFAAESIHMKRAVAEAGRRYQPTVEFRARVLDSIGVREPKRRPLFWIQFAFAAALLFAIMSGVFALRGLSGDVTREIADLHLNTIASTNPVDVVSSDMHTVKPWFQGKIPFTFNVPDLANSPFTLVGGRVVYIRSTPCAQLLFQYKLHRISTLIGPANLLGGSEEQKLPNGFRLVRLERNGYSFVAIGDAGADTIADLAQRVRAAQD